MRSMLATLVAALCTTALVLGLGATVGASADAAPHAHHLVADNQGPTLVTR